MLVLAPLEQVQRQLELLASPHPLPQAPSPVSLLLAEPLQKHASIQMG